VLVRDAAVRRVGRLALQGGEVAVEAHDLPLEPRQAAEQRLLRDQRARAGGGELMVQAGGRMLVVKRHIRATRLQNPEHADNHLDRAIGAQSDADFRADPQARSRCASWFARASSSA